MVSNDIVNDLNLNTVSDSETLSTVIEKIISNNPVAVTDFKSGKDSAIKYLMGQLMKETKGQADPKQSIEIIRSKLTVWFYGVCKHYPILLIEKHLMK